MGSRKLPPYRVLVVDDDPLAVDVLKEALEKHRFNDRSFYVETAGDGREAYLSVRNAKSRGKPISPPPMTA